MYWEDGKYTITVRKVEEKIPLPRSRRRWDNNTSINMGLQDIGCEGVEQIQVDSAKQVMNFRFL